MIARVGLLIVNADDWGLDVATTDAIAECFAAGRVTSATAMAYMADSERAAALADSAGLPVGLHLNLSEPFTATTVPDDVRHRQAAIARQFGDRQRRWRRWVVDPTIRAQVEQCVRDQLARFEGLYGRPPTHVDGHKHVQVSPNVARTPALSGVPLRRAVSDPPGARSPMVLARRLRHRLALADHAGTDRFFSISSMRDELLAGRVPATLTLAKHEVVEVMAHPGAPAERALLVTDAWSTALAQVRLGTYADLDSR